MDDKQLAMILTAMSDQTNALNRMADALAGILLHLDPKQAAKFAGPGFQRPLAAYATFDWNSIDAHVISFDRHGATEVEHNGVSYRRYRSNDDDPKGVDIRFRRVVSGTPEGKDMVWATLIKFADRKAKDPPRPLRGELAEKIEAAAEQAAQQASVTIISPAAAPRPALNAPAAPPIPVAQTTPPPAAPAMPKPEPVVEPAEPTESTSVAEAAQKLGGKLRTEPRAEARTETKAELKSEPAPTPAVPSPAASPAAAPATPPTTPAANAGPAEVDGVLAELVRRFDSLPSGSARTAALRSLKAEINAEALKRGLEPFEGRSGESLAAAEKRMRSVLNACIEADAKLAKA